MTLPQLLSSLTDAERNFIAGLDYGVDIKTHRAALDEVIERQGEINFDAQGFWYPYEVIELGKNWLLEGHEREYAACLGIVLRNIELDRNRSNDVEYILEHIYNFVRALPPELREMIDLQIERIIQKTESGDANDSRRRG